MNGGYAMRKAFLLVLGLMTMLFAACDTGLPRFTPAEGSYTEGGGTNRYSFVGGGTGNYTAPDGGFVIDAGGDTGGEEEEE